MKNSSKQYQVRKVFNSLWNDKNVYSSTKNTNDKIKLLKWSDFNLVKWLKKICKNKEKIDVLDAGCGLSYNFLNLLEIFEENKNILFPNIKKPQIFYKGIDLIDLRKANTFLVKNAKVIAPSFVLNCNFKKQDILKIKSDKSEKFDLIFAFGSLHHTPSVSKSIIVLQKSLKEKGFLIGWIINKQKPLRIVTDKFFRNYFSKFSSISDCIQELKTLSTIFKLLSKKIEKTKIKISNSIKFLSLQPGTYNLQTLLYDYFIKIYYNKNETEKRRIHQLFDWFNPKYYHQTTKNELKQILTKQLNLKNVSIVEKTNGIFFCASNNAKKQKNIK